MNSLNIEQNRKMVNYSKTIYVKRILWSFANLFFRFSPRIAFGYRNSLLRLFGARIGKSVHIYSSANIYFPWNLEIGDWSAIAENVLIYNLGKVIIGERTTISHCAHICAGTHDYSDVKLPLIKPTIRVGNQCWVCANAFVGPGVSIEDGAIIGAGAVITRDAKSWGIYAGNPAVYLKKRIITSKN